MISAKLSCTGLSIHQIKRAKNLEEAPRILQSETGTPFEKWLAKVAARPIEQSKNAVVTIEHCLSLKERSSGSWQHLSK